MSKKAFKSTSTVNNTFVAAKRKSSETCLSIIFFSVHSQIN